CLMSEPFAYDPVSGSYVKAAVLEPWRGYAVLAAEECTITFPGGDGGEVEIVYADTLPDEIIELGDGTRAVARQLVVRRADGVDEAAFLKRISEAGGVVRGVNGFLKIYQIEFADGPETAARTLLGSAEVEAAAPNIIFRVETFTPDDPPYAAGAPDELAWAFRRIGAPDVWSAAPQAGAPVIAVVDTGVDGAHPDLAGRVMAGAGFVIFGDPADTDPHGHGTHIAGIAAAGGNNGTGIAGLCWNCRVMPVKVCNAAGDCPFFSVLNGITHAANSGADVVNISLTANVAADSPARQIFQDVLDYAAGKGSFVVAAAGNSGIDAAGVIPASLEKVFTVAATEESDGRAAFSNFGGAVDIAAPGSRVYSLEPGGGAGYRDGTSAAAGFVSGAVGLVLTLQPTLTNSEVEELLASTAAPTVSAEPLGAGRLDLTAAHEKMYPSNKPPEITEFKISGTEVAPGGTVQVSFRAIDPDGDNVSYSWSVSAGALSAPNSTTTDWTLPATRGVYRVTVHVFDGRGGNASEERKVTVGAADIGILRVHPSAIVLKQGESVELKAYGILFNGNRVAVVPDWRLDVPVGVINGSRLTATADGEATLTASIGTVDSKARVLVNENGSFPSLTVAGFVDAGVTFQGDWHEAIVIGDLNGDGLNDIVVGQNGQENYVYMNNPGSPGTFSLDQTFGGGALLSSSRFLELGDIDNDGDLDLVEAGDGGAGKGWQVYKNVAGVLAFSQKVGAGKNANSARLADVDNDGDLDLIGAVSLNGDTSYVFFNDGSGDFAAIPPQSVGYVASITQRIEPADVDLDGDVDLVLANLFSGDLVFENVGGVFSDTFQNLGGTTGHIVLADVNGDGFIDILQSDILADVVNVFFNDGAGTLTFTSAGSFDNQTNYFLDAGDLWDNDGDLDVVTAPDSGDQRVYRNNGGGGFPGFQGPFGIAARAVRVGDLDDDDNLDFANASDFAETGGLNEVFLNDGLPSPNSAPAVPAGLASNVTATDVELSWNASSDAQSPASLLTYDLRVGSVSGGNDIFSGAVKAGPGNVGHPVIGGTLKHTLDISGLIPGTYYWSVRAADTQYIRSGWVEDSFTILAPAAVCAGWQVTSAADSGNNTLRDCIDLANTTAGTKNITFAAGMSGQTITLTSFLPFIDNTAGGETTIINGTVGEITVDGNNDDFDCFTITSADNEIRGLTIVNCFDLFQYRSGIRITGASAAYNTIAGNYIGTNWAHTPGKGNNVGVYIINGANYNTIGGDTSADRNIISGNSYGVYIKDPDSDYNEVKGNYIGTDKNGAAQLENSNGVVVSEGAGYNTIGGVNNPGPGCAGQCNLISGNSSTGVGIVSGPGTEYNEVIGNYIGTNVSGAAAIANNAGVQIYNSATNNTVGGTAPGEANLIAYNLGAGVYLDGNDTDYNTISRNSIYGNGELGIDINPFGVGPGSDANDDLPAPEITCVDNLGGGSYEVRGTVQDQFGAPCAGCTVELFRVDNDGAVGPVVLAEDAYAPPAVGEAFEYLDTATSGAGGDFTFNSVTVAGGVYITATVTDTLFNTSEFAVNVDVGNPPAACSNCPGWLVTTAADAGAGSLRQCLLDADAAAGTKDITFDPAVDWDLPINTITLASALPAIANTATGKTTVKNTTGDEVTVDGNIGGFTCFTITSADNEIHGLTIVLCNDVGLGFIEGIHITGASATGNTIAGNYIGTNSASAAGLSNERGIRVGDGAKNNIIGGTAAADRNIISGNEACGVEIFNAGTDGNKVSGNYIGTNAAGTAPLANACGVWIDDFANNNTIGGNAPGEMNIISGNTDDGVKVIGGDGNMVIGNYIGTNATGSVALGNGSTGVLISFTNNTIVGATAGGRNIISGNSDYGVYIDGGSGNKVAGNYIGTDVTGTAAIGNDYGVLIFGSNNNIIGGDSAAGEGNLISGNSLGVVITETGANGNKVTGNYIGTDVFGVAALGNTWHGIYILVYPFGGSPTSNEIGGSAAGEPNLIAYNGDAGVKVEGVDTDFNTISRNQIYENTGLGIDLDGAGANEDIGAPVINSIAINGANYDVEIDLSGCTTANCNVELFCVDDPPGITPDGTGAGEGFAFLKDSG
ncbi:MAG: S8 family serine peptidase, partial [bacterium]